MLAQSSTASCTGENAPANYGSLGHDSLQADEEDRLQHRDYSNPVEALHQAPLAKQDSSPQVEEIAPWCDISYFIGLYLRYQHALMPLVHKPTFTNDIVLRKDRSDETFRALLLSLTAYTICQVPLHLMDPPFSQRQLEKLQTKCHTASRAIQVRHLEEPNMNIMVTMIADTYHCAATNRTQFRDTLMGTAARLVYALGYNVVAPTDNLIDAELKRRIFWHLYCHEKTDAAMGNPILMHDHEGVPPYPLETDDEFITAAGYVSQPLASLSYMVGYVYNIRLFRFLSTSLLRRRLLECAALGELNITLDEGWNWAEEARHKISCLQRELPVKLRALELSHCSTSDQPDIFQTQRANIVVTAAIVEFALLDYQASARPQSSLIAERHRVARETYRQLSNISATQLASNGESMRSKVISIILVLFNSISHETDLTQGDVRNWWEMYCKVQFVQMIPSGVESLGPSRAPSPSIARPG